MKKYFFLVLPILIGGCAKDISPQTYSVGSVGQVNRTVAAKVINVREVDVSGTTGLGGGTGAAMGGIAGSSLGGNNFRGNLAGAVGGAIVGGIAGAAIEASATKQKALEYIVETENGSLMTIVQGADTFFPVNSKVFVLYGNPSRIIPDSRQNK